MAIYRAGGTGYFQTRRKTYAKRIAAGAAAFGGVSLLNRGTRRHVGLALRHPRRFGKSIMRMGRTFGRKFRAAGAIGRMMR